MPHTLLPILTLPNADRQGWAVGYDSTGVLQSQTTFHSLHAWHKAASQVLPDKPKRTIYHSLVFSYFLYHQVAKQVWLGLQGLVG